MKAVKHTVRVTIEVLDEMSVPGLLMGMVEAWDNEVRNGELQFRDGDTVRWTSKTEPVTV